MIIGREDNEGIRDHMGTLSPLSTWSSLIMVIFLKGRRLSFPLLLSLTLTHTQIKAHAPDCPAHTPHLIFTTGNRVSDFYSIYIVWESKNIFRGDLDTFKTLMFEQLPTQEKIYRCCGSFFIPLIPSLTLMRGMHICFSLLLLN